MAEQNTSKDDDQPQSVKKTKKKASTGPWWKSTTIEEATSGPPSSIQEAEPFPETAEQKTEIPSESVASVQNVAITDVKEIAATVA
ncbi:MAG TPA: hypothetical protein VJ969_07715, partial [Desulfopila sp.]|nr:hypothetical protein [Desulfopila sp.]